MSEDNPGPDDLYRVGVVATIMKMLKLPDGRVKILIQALTKARILDFTQVTPVFRVWIEKIEEPVVTDVSIEAEAMMRTIREHCEKTLALKGLLTNEILAILENIDDPGKTG